MNQDNSGREKPPQKGSIELVLKVNVTLTDDGPDFKVEATFPSELPITQSWQVLQGIVHDGLRRALGDEGGFGDG